MYLVRHDLALLEARRFPAGTPPPAALRLEELLPPQLDTVLQTYRDLGHRHPEGRPQRRFANGLRFGRLWLGETVVATTWVAHGVHRYIDELNWRLPMRDDQFWVRDVFVAPAWRGQRLFGHLLQLVATQWLPRFHSAWSDVDWDNAASIKAHLAAGFEVRHRVRSLDFNGRLRLRDPLVPWPGVVAALRPASRWVWLGGGERRQHLDWVA
jgi:GNAT superfamily N-acetyltransferase